MSHKEGSQCKHATLIHNFLNALENCYKLFVFGQQHQEGLADPFPQTYSTFKNPAKALGPTKICRGWHFCWKKTCKTGGRKKK